MTRFGTPLSMSSRDENGELKELVADLSLEAYRRKKTAIPMPQDATGTSG